MIVDKKGNMFEDRRKNTKDATDRNGKERRKEDNKIIKVKKVSKKK